jgi:uncharacterized protein
MLFMQETAEGIVFKIFVQPRASKNDIAGLHDDALKIRLTAPPVDNKANRMCVQFLAKQLGVSKSTLAIVSGQTGRSKNVLFRYENDPPGKDEAGEIKKRIKELVC